MTRMNMQQELINKINSYLNSDINHSKGIVDWLSTIKLLEDKVTTKISIQEYKDIIKKLNNIIKGICMDERYSFASEIQEELEAYDLEVRVCSICSSLMIAGYVIDGGSEYYCSNECLNVDMTLEEFEQLYNDGSTETYWTEWH